MNSHVSIGFECLDREMYDPECCYDLLQQSGVKYARVQTGWNRSETEKGIYTFAWLDEIVNNLLQRGIQPWFNVGFGNLLYMKDSRTPSAVGQVPVCYDKEVMRAWLNFVQALTKHFKERVRYYEIWNEPDISHFWAPGKSNPEEYAFLINETAVTILNEYPDAKIGACMANAFASESNGDYLWKLVKNIKRLDFFCYHRYNGRADVDLMKNVDFMRRVFLLNNMKDIEIWGGECGYGSYLPTDHTIMPLGKSSEQQQAVSLLRYFVTDAAVGCRLTSFFNIVDLNKKVYQTAADDRPNPALSGILNGLTYTPKKSYFALSNIANLLSDDFKVADRFISLSTRYRKPYVNMPHQPFCVAFERNGKPFYAYYYPTYIEKECGLLEVPVAVHLQNMLPEDTMTDPVAVDSLTGLIYEPDSRIDYESLTVLEGMPVAEYPIFIMERSEIDMELQIEL